MFSRESTTCTTLITLTYFHVAQFSAPTVIANTFSLFVITPSIVASTRTRFTTIFSNNSNRFFFFKLIFFSHSKQNKRTNAQQRFLPQQAFPVVNDLLQLDTDLDPTFAQTDARPQIDVAAERANTHTQTEARALRDEIETSRGRERHLQQ